MSIMISPADEAQRKGLQRYYKWHARVYDATRWSFLFGRHALLRQVAKVLTPQRILEVGCGTGTNLLRLAKNFPHAQITGVDLSADMLAVARRKLADYRQDITLLQQAYAAPLPGSFDLIVFSYSLSMMNPGWEQALTSAWRNLSDKGVLAVVDFADTPSTAFRQWMGINHVRMEGQLPPVLNAQFKTILSQQHKVYAGLWRYLMFIGSKTIRGR